MLFKPELCQAILDGRKTETRRLVKYGDGKLNLGEQLWFMQGVGSNIGSIFQDGRNRTPTVVTRWQYSPYRIKWQVGRTYAIQPGRGKRAVGRFLLTGIHGECLQDITGQDAVNEGFQPIQHSASVVLIPAPQVADGIAIRMFAKYWDSLHRPKHHWHKNPEVWVLELGNAI